MKKRILITGLACVLAFNIVACGSKNSSSKETTKKIEESTTESSTKGEKSNTYEPQIANEDALTFYNAVDGSEYGEPLYNDIPESILKVIEPIKDEKNLVKSYKKDDSKESETLIPLLKLRTDNEKISYIGDDKWAFETDDEVSIYQVKGDNPSLPCAFLTSYIFVPFAFANSQNDNETRDEFLVFRTLDTGDIVEKMNIDISKVSDKSTAVIPDLDVAVENLYVYKNDSTYTRYLCTKELTGKQAGDCYMEKTDSDSSTSSNEVLDLYSFFRYKDKAFGRDGKDEKWYAIDKRDDDIIKQEKIFYEQLKNDYKFLYGFPLKLHESSLTIEVYQNDDSYVGVLLDSENNPFKAWFMNNDGLTIVTDITYDTEHNTTEEIRAFFDDCYSQINPIHIAKRPEKKETEKKEYKSSEYATDLEKDLAGEEYTLGEKTEKTEVVDKLIKALKEHTPLTFNYTETSDPKTTVTYENITDGKSAYTVTYTTPDKKTTILMKDGYMYTDAGNPGSFIKDPCDTNPPVLWLPMPLGEPDTFKFAKAKRASTSASDDYIVEYWKWGPENVAFVIKDNTIISLAYTYGTGPFTCKIDKIAYEADSSKFKVPSNVVDSKDK